MVETTGTETAESAEHGAERSAGEPALPLQLGSNLLSWAPDAEPETVAQAASVAALPFARRVALMPDAHAGKGSSVGTVILTEGAVVPAAVGVDVGCGVVAAQTSWTREDLQRAADHGRELGGLLEDLRAAVPVTAGQYNGDLSPSKWPGLDCRIEALEEEIASRGVGGSGKQQSLDLVAEHPSDWRHQLGTLGGGNHFAELSLDGDDAVWMVVHSGSRGVGNKLASWHIARALELCRVWHVPLAHPDLAYLPQGVPEFGAYLRDLNWAQKFAFENRAEMLARFERVLREWVGADGGVVRTVNNHHNYTAPWKRGGKKQKSGLWITRKGAIDAAAGVWGVIPGSMGTATYVVEGLGHDGAMDSAPHGAGRLFSRGEAKRRLDRAVMEQQMAGIAHRTDIDLLDEAPGAYRDITDVMRRAAGLVEIRYELHQLMNLKGE